MASVKYILEFKKEGMSPLKPIVDPKKSKILSFPSIKDALGKKNYGTVFSTPESDRIYVITKGTWGKKSTDKVVKGFPTSTPLSEIQNYAKRTQAKHGSKPVGNAMGNKQQGKEEAGYATQRKPDKTKNFKPLF